MPLTILFICSEMLELLEDKLREYRLLTLNPREYDDRTVTLSQLDSLRRELIDTARTKLAFTIFGKARSCQGHPVSRSSQAGPASVTLTVTATVCYCICSCA